MFQGSPQHFRKDQGKEGKDSSFMSNIGWMQPFPSEAFFLYKLFESF